MSSYSPAGSLVNTVSSLPEINVNDVLSSLNSRVTSSSPRLAVIFERSKSFVDLTVSLAPGNSLLFVTSHLLIVTSIGSFSIFSACVLEVIAWTVPLFSAGSMV